MLPRSCYDYSTTITDHRLVLSIRSDYDGTSLYDMLSVRRHTYSGACFLFFFLEKFRNDIHVYLLYNDYGDKYTKTCPRFSHSIQFSRLLLPENLP